MDKGEFEQFASGSQVETDESTDRRSRRAPVLLAAEIEFGRSRLPVKVRNVSEKGALIEGDHLPPEGATGTFSRNGLSVDFTVVWVQDRYAGVAFVRALNREEVLRYVPQGKQPERYTHPFKRPGLACRPLTPYERKNLELWMTSSPSLGD
jgi:hypothetical protein